MFSQRNLGWSHGSEWGNGQGVMGEGLEKPIFVQDNFGYPTLKKCIIQYNPLPQYGFPSMAFPRCNSRLLVPVYNENPCLVVKSLCEIQPHSPAPFHLLAPAGRKMKELGNEVVWNLQNGMCCFPLLNPFPPPLPPFPPALLFPCHTHTQIWKVGVT